MKDFLPSGLRRRGSDSSLSRWEFFVFAADWYNLETADKPVFMGEFLVTARRNSGWRDYL
jgi:hypothetical protein